MYGLPTPSLPPPRKTVNVTVIAFALIMRQRKPCRASGFVNGPTDGSLHFASEQKSQGFPPRDQPWASSASLLSLNLKGKKRKPGHDKLFLCRVWICRLCLRIHLCRIHAVASPELPGRCVCGCHQCPCIPISLDSNKKQGLQSAQIVRISKVPHRSYFTPTYFL